MWKNYYKPENEKTSIYVYKNNTSETIICCIELFIH